MTDFKLIRSDRKTVGISVGADGTVTVRAPRRMAYDDVRSIVEKHTLWIKKKKEQRRVESKRALTEEDKAILRRLCERVALPRLRYYAELTGLNPSKVRVSSAEKRFGSCSAKGSISISFYAMLCREEALDLILVHELCHLRHMDHSERFYSLLSKYLPDHGVRKKLLRPENMYSMEQIRDKYKEYL